MKYFRVRWQYVLMTLGLLALVLLVRDFNSRMAELHRLTVERDRVGAKVTSMIATYHYLETQVVLATSDLFVEEIAREELKYSKEGDNPIVLIGDAEDTQGPALQVAPIVQPIERWELWLALFIDPESSDGTVLFP
jgi:cell division protein FtsB